MEGVQDVDSHNEVIDDFYVVDAWSEKQGLDVSYINSTGRKNIDVSSTKGYPAQRRKPTEGEIDEFLESLKELNSKCGTSGLEEDDCFFKSTNPSSKIIEIPEESTKDTLYPVKSRGEKFFSNNQLTCVYTESVIRYKPSTVSYKPGGTLTKTFFPESSVKAKDFSNFLNNNQEIGISSSDTLFYLSFNQNEDSGGAFSDIKGSNLSNELCESANKDRPSHHQRRTWSGSSYRNPLNSSIRFSDKESDRLPSWDRNRNLSMDTFRTDGNGSRERRHRDDPRRPRRSRSRSRERHRHRSRSPRRLYRPSLSLSPTPPLKRDVVNETKMEPRPPPYYQSSGFRDASGPTNPTFMNPNLGMPVPPVPGPDPVQYPINPANSYGRFPGYNPMPNMFNNGPPQPLGFQPQMLQNYPQNQFPQTQNFPGFNPSVQIGMHENPSNPVPFPSSWNQPGHGFDPNYPMSNIPATVAYPHLKIGQPRADSFSNNQERSDDSPRHKQGKSSSDKRKYTRSKSPDSKKHRKKTSKRNSKSPSSNRKNEDRNKRYEKECRSPTNQSRFESKRPRVIIDPNRIPTPPPPPIVGSYDIDDAKVSGDQKAKIPDKKADNDPLSDFLNKEKVSLSCLLEAVMENSGQGKSQLSDPKVKKEIISKCESKIRHLYKRRMTGLGAFIPDPVQFSHPIDHYSPLVAVSSLITYNCEVENIVWQCPEIVIPEVKKLDQDGKINKTDVSTIQEDQDGSTFGTKNPTVIPTLANNQIFSKQNWDNKMPPHISNQNTYTNVYENNHQNMFPPYQPPQNWMNPATPQNQFHTQRFMRSHTSEIPILGPPGYQPRPPFNMHPRPEFMPPQPGYPPRPGMLTYPSRVDYPPMRPIPPQNLNHPGMFNRPQHNPINNSYQFNIDEASKSSKNKNNVNNNLIILNNSDSHPNSVQKNIQKGGKTSSKTDLMDENDLTRHKVKNNDDNKIPTEANAAKDKLLRKLWQLRKSSDYVHVPLEQQCTKEQDDKFYQKLNYAEMQEDTQLDTIHDYQLINLRERIETCLSEGKVHPDSQHRSSDRRDGDRDRERERQRERDRGRDRERERIKEKERSRREPNESDRKRHGRSPLGDERKKYRSGESHHDRRRSRDSPSHKEQGHKSNKDEVIEILSDDEHKQNDSSTNEGSTNQNDKGEPPEKSLTTLIFDLLGPEIRKIQEKSDLYKSIIVSLEQGDRAYKRLYSFRNTTLIKSEKDCKMKMVVPRDNLKEVVIAVHKNFHNIQSEELSRVLKDLIYPNMLHIPKCVSKIVSECPACIEQRKKEEKKDDVSKDKKSDKVDRKQEKRTDRSVRDRDKDRRNSHDRDRRISKDKSSLSSKGRRDLSRSGKERDIKESSENDGRPTGYEKAKKVKKTNFSVPAEANKSTVCAEPCEEKSMDQPEDKSSQVLHELSDKALEFKNISEPNIEESEDKTVDAENANQQPSSCTSTTGNNNKIASSCEPIKDNADDKNLERKTEPPSDKIDVNNEVAGPLILKTVKDSTNPSNNSLNTTSEGNIKSSGPDAVNKDSVEEAQEKTSPDIKPNKDAPILDFKGRVRQVQMNSCEYKDIIARLESVNDGRSVDSCYLMKGGMLCKKNSSGSATEVKIVAPPDELEDLVNIVHTMSAVHTSAAKVVIFFSKHFTQVDNLDLKVNEFVNKCSNCKLKDS